MEGQVLRINKDEEKEGERKANLLSNKDSKELVWYEVLADCGKTAANTGSKELRSDSWSSYLKKTASLGTKKCAVLKERKEHFFSWNCCGNLNSLSLIDKQKIGANYTEVSLSICPILSRIAGGR